MKEQTLSMIRAKGNVSFAEMEREIPGFKGNWALELEHNLMLWCVSEETSKAFLSLMEEKKIVGNSCSVLVYVADGIMSGLPVAKRLQPYKSPRWLPVTFDLTEKVTEKDVRKSLLQTAREAM